MHHFRLIQILILSVFEASFQPEPSFRVILLSISVLFPILKRSNIHIVLSHQLPFALVNTMLEHSFVILPLFLHEEETALLSHIERPCEFGVVFEVYLDTVSVLVSEVMFAVVHLIVEVVNNALVSVRARFGLAPEVNAIFVFFDRWVREIDVEFFDELAEYIIDLLYCRVLCDFPGVVPTLDNSDIIQVFDACSI